MSLPLYFDEHVHGVLRKALLRLGIDVLTVQEDERCGLSDAGVMNRATELRRLLVSNDEDMLVLARQRQKQGRHFPGLLFLKRAPLRMHIDDLAFVAEVAGEEELADTVLFLPL
jgi:hypothetical protein